MELVEATWKFVTFHVAQTQERAKILQMSTLFQQARFKLCFKTGAFPQLDRTEFYSRGQCKTFPMASKGWGAQMIGFCAFFVDGKIAWLNGKVRGDFTQSDEESESVQTFADSLENSEPSLETIFGTDPGYKALFRPVYGDNRSKTNLDAPRVVRLRSLLLPMDNVEIVCGNNENPSKEELVRLADWLLREWSRRSRSRKARRRVDTTEGIGGRLLVQQPKLNIRQLLLPTERPESEQAIISWMGESAKGMDPRAFKLAEGAWPLHQTLDKPYAEITQSIKDALTKEDVGFAFAEYRRSLFYSGYHEEWATRRELTEKLLKTKLGPLDLGWIWLKGKGYMETELRRFDSAKLAISDAQEMYRQGNFDEGIGLCYRYLGDLYEKSNDVPKAIENKVESLKHLKGVPATESELELELLQLKYFTPASEAKLRKLEGLGERLREIQGWRYWLTEVEQGKTLCELGEIKDGLTVLRYVEFAFRNQITMERTRKLVLKLIAAVESDEAGN